MKIYAYHPKKKNSTVSQKNIKKSTRLRLEAAEAFDFQKNAVAAAESGCSEQPKNL